MTLCQFYYDTRTDKSWDLEVKGYTANALERLGRISHATSAYRELLDNRDDLPFFPHLALIDAPLMIARKGNPTDFDFASKTIERARQLLAERGIMLVRDKFMLHAADALLSSRTGDKENAKKHAHTVLRAAAIRTSSLRYHQTAGLLDPEDDAIVYDLKSIVSGIPAWMLKAVTLFGRLTHTT